MKLKFLNRPNKNSVLLYPVFEKEIVRDAALNRLLKKLKADEEFEAKEGQIFFLFGASKSLPEKIVLLGLGNRKKLNVATVMSAIGAGVKMASGHKPKTLSFVLREAPIHFAQAAVEAAALANYQPAAPYKTGKAYKKIRLQRVEVLEIVGGGKKIQQSARKGLILADAVNEVRDWVNAPPNFANAKFFDEKAAEIAKETGAKLTILRKKELEKLNMGALLGVNRGSPDEARLIILDYTPKSADPKKPPLVFVGKGILFDSGGYNLKPRGYIEDMQLDKAGAAAVLALIKLLPKLNIKRRVIGIAPFTENLIGKHALKPSEILETYSGKTVEITNTDAEGRLVLSDALAYAADKYKPEFLVDIATLTGACMVALGDRYAGLFGNDKDLAEKLRAAGEEVDELLWPMPLHKEHGEKMKGVYADLRNADLGSERNAGASKGAAFLQEFVGKTKWAHLDIAGPAFTEDPKKYETKGATGFGVRALARFLEKL